MSTPPPPTGMRVRASEILRVRKIWLVPVLIAAVFVGLMSVIYFGSVVNPTGHLHGLPVIVVNEDRGATVKGQELDVGASLVSALQQSSDVATRRSAPSSSRWLRRRRPPTRSGRGGRGHIRGDVTDGALLE